MHRVLLAACFSAAFGRLSAQPDYSGDNTRYGTISWEALPEAIKVSPNALLLDVRTPGEFSDTSFRTSTNIGRLKGAINIDDREVASRLNELPDRTRPVYVYCSHSQRSRRVSSMLADSGYTNVINVNGGLSRYWSDKDLLPRMDALVERSNGYGILNPKGLCDLVAHRNVLLLDVRPDPLLSEEKRTAWMIACGRIKGSKRVSSTALGKAMDGVPHDRPIVVLANQTADETVAARTLTGLGYTDVHVLFGGLENWMHEPEQRCPCKDSIWESEAPYAVIGLDRLDTLAITTGKALVLDIRPQDEYDGDAKMKWTNLGRFRVARHVPADSMNVFIAHGDVPKDTPLILIGRTHEERLFDAAGALGRAGYPNVRILSSGIWGIRWEAHNLPGMSAWDTWVVPYSNGQ